MTTVATNGTARQAATCVASLAWDDVLSGQFPATSHTQRWQRAVTDAARDLVRRPELQPRLQAATELVLAEAVGVGADGYNTVQSGTKTYRFEPESGCPCQDATHRSRYCKHTVAVLLQQAARRLYAQDVQAASGTAPQKEATMDHPDDLPPVASILAGDDVLTPADTGPVLTTPPPPAVMTEAPYSATFKAYRKGFSVLLTVRKQDRQDFLDAVLRMPDWLEAQGYTPEAYRPEAPAKAEAPPLAPASCRYHGAQQMRPSKYGEGRFVCSMKLEDGSYCNQIWPPKAKSTH